jgi:plastocyanin
VEDPGNGTGFLTLLERARAEARTQGADTQAAETLLGRIQDASRRLQADAQAVIQASDVNGITQPIEEAAGLAALLRDPQTGLIAQFAESMHLASARPTAAVQASSPTGAATVTVAMDNFAFDPKTLQVKKGTTVVFVNHDSAKHTVTSDSGKFDSGDIDPGGSYQFTFNETGQFPYYCRFHGDKGGVDMAGVITVAP